MRTFQIIIITVLLLFIAGIALFWLKGWIGVPTASPGEDYWEDQELPSPEALYGKTLKQYDGVLKESGISMYMQGTHRLEKDGVLVALLESTKVNLPDFVGKEVRVKGVVRDTVEGGQKIMTVDFIEVLKDQGVKVFEAPGYAFRFSYPGEWEVNLEENKVTFQMQRADELSTVMIVYQYEMVKAPLDVWLKDRDQNLVFEESTVKVGDTTGFRRTIRNGDQVIVKTYVKGGNFIYELRLIAQDDASRTQYYSIVDFFQMSGVSIPESKVEEQGAEPEQIQAEVPEEKVVEPEAAAVPISSLGVLPPLSVEDIEKAVQKGFTVFQGKSLSFEYPKSWYFSYLGNQVYGFTDKLGYEKGNFEILKEFSRILLIPEDRSESCAYQKSVSAWIVCAKEPALAGIADHLAGSVR